MSGCFLAFSILLLSRLKVKSWSRPKFMAASHLDVTSIWWTGVDNDRLRCRLVGYCLKLNFCLRRMSSVVPPRGTERAGSHFLPGYGWQAIFSIQSFEQRGDEPPETEATLKLL